MSAAAELLPARRLSARVARDGRPIDWEAFDRGGLEGAGRARVGESWRSRMVQEHLAVGAFATLVHELAEEGCAPVVLAMLTKAASDEVRHMEICRRLSEEILGEPVAPRTKGVPSIPKHRDAPATTRALLHVVEMCCLSETLTGVYLTEMLARMPDGGAKSAVESLLEDEIDHGRVGWAYLAERAQARELGGLLEALPAMLNRTFGGVLRHAKAHPENDNRAMEAVGYLGASAGGAIYQRTLREVVLPGFEECGVDMRRTRKWVAEQGWL
jgi:hypothetical protein